MKYLQLEIRNWGRFRDPVLVSFESTNEKNIILINAFNDKGKTSFFYAIKYLLYGERALAAHPRESYRKLSEWPNYYVAKEGDGVLSVELKIQLDDNSIIRIQRKRGFFQTPTGEEIQLTQKDELEIFSEEEPIDVGKTYKDKQNWIEANILPFDASQFFQFDGEVIQQYMNQPEVNVQRAIEQVLGLKELKNAEADLGILFETVQKDTRKKAKLVTKDSKTKDAIELLELEIKNDKQLLDDTKKEKMAAEKVVEDCNKRLKEYQQIAVHKERQESLRDDIKKDKKILEELAVDLREKRDYAGLLLVNPIMSIISTTDETPPSKEQWESTTASFLIDSKFDSCVCDTKIDKKVEKLLKDKILTLKDNPFSKLKRLVEVMNSAYHPDKLYEKLSQILNQISDTHANIKKNGQEVDDISKLITSDAKSDSLVKELEERSKETIKAIGKFEGGIIKVGDHLEKSNSKLANLINKISQSSADKEVQESIELEKFVSDVKEVFINSFRKYFTKRKPELEAHISKIFLKLTNNPELYKKIILGDDFSIKIGRQDGTLLPSHRYSPSAGAGQIAATAVIGGFNKFTTRKSPVVIDTPAGRLDPIHKENLLNYYPKMSNQVIILPQPDEIDAKDEQIISDFVSKTYDIVDKSDDPAASIIIQRPSN